MERHTAAADLVISNLLTSSFTGRSRLRRQPTFCSAFIRVQQYLLYSPTYDSSKNPPASPSYQECDHGFKEQRATPAAQEIGQTHSKVCCTATGFMTQAYDNVLSSTDLVYSLLMLLLRLRNRNRNTHAEVRFVTCRTLCPLMAHGRDSTRVPSESLTHKAHGEGPGHHLS